MNIEYEEKHGIHPKTDYGIFAEFIQEVQKVLTGSKMTVRTKDPLFMEVLKEKGIEGNWKRLRKI